MKITFLGTGTSTGIPQIGCQCEVCKSKDLHDKRLRCSCLIETEGKRILIDCGPDFRQQMLNYTEFAPIDAVLITHEHYDHVGGLDDLRPFCKFGSVSVYADTLCCKDLRQRYPYCFVEKKYRGVPEIDLQVAQPHEAIKVGEVSILPFEIMHGKLPILGFRIKNFAYITDMKSIAPQELPYLQGVQTLVVNGLRQEPHPTHQTLEEAVSFAQRVRAKETYLIHMSHDAGLHQAITEKLPASVHLAYDGLQIEG